MAKLNIDEQTIADKMIREVAKSARFTVDFSVLEGYVSRLATAAERIADALEASRDDPDAYEYYEANIQYVEKKRAEGFKVCYIGQYTNEDGADVVYVMRRPRQDAPPGTVRNIRVNDFIITPSGLQGYLREIENTAEGQVGRIEIVESGDSVWVAVSDLLALPF